jgi:hypothetical protein
VGEAHTQGKSRVSHRPLRQGRHAGRCGAAGARTVRARAVVAWASVLPPEGRVKIVNAGGIGQNAPRRSRSADGFGVFLKVGGRA